MFDLGKQVPLNTIIDKALEVEADAIGLSALLVSTSKQMPACVKELDERGLSYPLIIGGAAINRGFGRRILYLDQERAYEPGVFYCKDAFEGLETVDQLLDPDRHDALLTRVLEEARVHRVREHEKLERRNAAAAGAAVLPARSTVASQCPDPHSAVLGRARAARYSHLGRLPVHRPQLALQDELAVPRCSRPGQVGGVAAHASSSHACNAPWRRRYATAG